MKRFVFLLALLLFLPFPVRAQNEFSEKIISFDSQITINQDNQAQITETIVYDFGLNQKRGIYRYVPIKTIAGDTNEYYFYDIEWGSVTQDGVAANVKNEGNNESGVIRIGDPDITISGIHTYIINYTLEPVVESDPLGDFLNLNLAGVDWNVPIQTITAKIALPNSALITEGVCYSGARGSTSQNCDIKTQENVATISSTNLSAYEGVTVNILSEGGDFTAYLSPQAPPPPDLRPLIGLLIGALAFVFGIILRVRAKLDQRRRKKDQTIVPQYESPKDLTIGEIGTLHDNTADMKEITATLIDLAVRGYIKITQLNKKSLFKSAQYQFDLLKDKYSLNSDEQKLLDLIFNNGAKSANLKDVSKTKAGKVVPEVKKSFAKHLEKKGYTVKSNKLASQKVLNKIFALSILAILASAVALFIINTTSDSSDVTITPLAIAGIVLAVLGYAISTTIHITDMGYSKWAEIEGLIMYLSVAEKERLAFHDAPEKTPELFSALLPAAVALGVDKQWANQFKDLDIAENVDWYSGPNAGFNSVILASSLSSDLNSTVASSFTPPSQSTGGSSGGGFSGGGGGGGGGGSW